MITHHGQFSASMTTSVLLLLMELNLLLISANIQKQCSLLSALQLQDLSLYNCIIYLPFLLCRVPPFPSSRIYIFSHYEAQTKEYSNRYE